MFHRWIEEKIAKIDPKDYIEPEHEMNSEKEHLLGEMSDDLKRLLTLWQRVSQENQALAQKSIEIIERTIHDLPAIKPGDEEAKKIQAMLKAMVKQQSIAEEREEALRQVFWVSVWDEFPAAEGYSLAVCKGFKVVWYDKEKEKETPKFIRLIFAS